MKTGTFDTVKSTPPGPRMSASPGNGEGVLSRFAWWERSRSFFTEVRNEMKRVTWPTRREVYATTIVVILVSVFFGLYLWIVDLSLSAGIHWLLERFGAR